MSTSWRKRTLRICGGDFRSGPRDACLNELHNYPLPSGYADAIEAAERRVRHRWGCARCTDCGLYGWTPADPAGDPCDGRVPAAIAGAKLEGSAVEQFGSSAGS